MVQALIHGNGYAEIVRDVVGRIKELWFIPSEWVNVQRNTETGQLFYQISDNSGVVKNLLPEDVYHLRALSSVSQLMGDSPIARASRAIALAHASERYALNYYGSNATVGGVLKLPRTLKPEEEDALQQSWSTGRSGVQNSHKTAVLPPGVEWQPMSNNAEESQVLSSRQFSVDEIIRYFGVPGVLLNQNVQLPGQNIEGLGLMFVRHTLRPWAKRLEQEANYKLFPQKAPWKFTEIELEWLTEGDAKTRADTYSVYLNAGVMSINEVRDELCMNEIEGGDNYKGIAPEPTDAPSVVEPQDTTVATSGSTGSDTVTPETPSSDQPAGLENLYRLVLTNHANRIDARETELRKTLKNGVLTEKLANAKDWSRGLVDRDLNKAGVNAPPGWMSAVNAMENGGNAADLARALVEVRN